ncbi:MAG TPA: hypothetical protein VFV67_30260 [Actinophytocola sp.]|uniref:hypothetical protein n=1 Tax=Actinophytocola sp. TaxID=1872138 RepID=UPI002DB79406|nr:hypothetical protein [Actinophytocola sp.]HEU5474948.1 hypothetical protein [Actinophytocola sp.]
MIQVRSPCTPYKAVLELLTRRGIGAVEVVTATGRVLGVVSERTCCAAAGSPGGGTAGMWDGSPPGS